MATATAAAGPLGPLGGTTGPGHLLTGGGDQPSPRACPMPVPVAHFFNNLARHSTAGVETAKQFSRPSGSESQWHSRLRLPVSQPLQDYGTLFGVMLLCTLVH